MSFEMPKVPPGSGKHPLVMIVISANQLTASSEFYTRLFGWQIQPFSSDMAGFVTPGGLTGALRANVPDGFPGMVPYLGATDLDATLAQVVAAGGSIERAPWAIPGIGKLARFKDSSGTIYGLTAAQAPGILASIPMPIATNPKPPVGSICHIEMYAQDGTRASEFFGSLFGWGTLPTMPQYVAFDPGAGVNGIFQSHTPNLPAVAYIYTADVAAKLAEIDSAGGKRIAEPIPMPGVGCFGYFTDPSGTSMGLIGP